MAAVDPLALLSGAKRTFQHTTLPGHDTYIVDGHDTLANTFASTSSQVLVEHHRNSCGYHHILDNGTSIPKRARTSPSRLAAAHSQRTHNSLCASSPWVTRDRIAQLFPDMSDADIDAALNAHGADIQKAIEHLANLRLARASSPTEPPTTAAAANNNPSPPASSTRSAPATPPPEPNDENDAANDAALPKTHTEWVDAVVGELQGAADVPSAKSIVSHALTAFERQVKRENTILKRAVAIQSARMEQMTSEGRRLNDEVSSLSRVCEEQQAEVQRLHASNYALSVHLQRASTPTNSNAFGPPGDGEAF